MEIKDIKKIDNGGYQCKIKHPNYGWIPFTARKDDPEEFGRELYKTIVAEERR